MSPPSPPRPRPVTAYEQPHVHHLSHGAAKRYTAQVSHATIPEKLKESRSRVRGCSRTGGPGCSSLPVGSNVWVLSVRLSCCALAHARGFVRRSELRWAPHTRGTGLGGTAGQHTLTASAPPFVPTLDAAFTTVSTALSVLWRRTKTSGAEDNVSRLARKQRGSPTTRANTPALVILRPCAAGLAGSFTASTCFRYVLSRVLIASTRAADIRIFGSQDAPAKTRKGEP